MANCVRWVGVALSVLSVIFAVLSYSGFWNRIRGDTSLIALESRINTSYSEVSRQVRPEDREWKPLLRVILKYTTAELPKGKQPVVLVREVAVSSAKSDAGEWTAPTTPLILIYRPWPNPGDTLLMGKDGFRVGTLGDFHEWIKRDQDEFDFFWRTLIFGTLSATVGVFLALNKGARKNA